MSMENKVKKLVKSVWSKIKWKKQIAAAVKEAKSCALATSYFPEKERKTEKQRIEENVAWAKKFGEPNKFYTLYGLDCIGSKPEDFVDYWHFMTSRNIANRMGQLDSQLVILRDKFMFYKYMKSCNLPVPEVFAILKKGKLYDVDFNEIEWKQLESPDNMAVMIAVDPEEDRWVCCDSRDLNRPYALAVVNIQFGAEVVPIDLVESTIDIDAQLVNRHKCIKCGREMKIRLEPGQGGYRAKYECKECNRLIELDPDGTEEEVNE